MSTDSKCRNLVYKEGGLSRAEYLPCAGEIVAALNVVDQNTGKALDGDGGRDLKARLHWAGRGDSCARPAVGIFWSDGRIRPSPT